jgi:hypothetical protein
VQLAQPTHDEVPPPPDGERQRWASLAAQLEFVQKDVICASEQLGSSALCWPAHMAHGTMPCVRSDSHSRSNTSSQGQNGGCTGSVGENMGAGLTTPRDNPARAACTSTNAAIYACGGSPRRVSTFGGHSSSCMGSLLTRGQAGKTTSPI